MGAFPPREEFFAPVKQRTCKHYWKYCDLYNNTEPKQNNVSYITVFWIILALKNVFVEPGHWANTFCSDGSNVKTHVLGLDYTKDILQRTTTFHKLLL